MAIQVLSLMNPIPSPEMAVGFLDLGLYAPGGLDVPAGLLGFTSAKWLYGSTPAIEARINWDAPDKIICSDKATGQELPATDLTGQVVSFIGFGQ